MANPRLMDGSKRRKRKNDRIDANKLARLGRVDPESLYPIQHRSREVRQDLVMLRARDALVAARTEIINTTRGLVKSMGTRLPKCSSRSFAQKGEEAVAVEMREALLPLVRLAATLSADIKEYDKKIEELGREKYGHTALLRQVKGVGPITALAYVLTLENPQRFAKSRDVGPYLGLVPKQEDSGESQPQLGIHQPTTRSRAPPRSRSRRLGLAESRVGCGDQPSEGRQAAWVSLRQLVERRGEFRSTQACLWR